ncbi:14906_t:CDS:2 [Acaulospora morrowiae]|uniref:14906_t:CDS:1 n=1 Tax=Acaulospora morrowiae TaxID=94023 RepID=A0A9N9FGL4_9GLOM|nr:14906_t:CDS:2 [Acaulospora morrowiae]
MNSNTRCSLPPISALLNSELDKVPLVPHATSGTHEPQIYIQSNLHSLSSSTSQTSQQLYNENVDKIQNTSPSTKQHLPPIEPIYHPQGSHQVSKSRSDYVSNLPPPASQQVQPGARGYPTEYDQYRTSFMNDVNQSAASLETDRKILDLKKIINHCTLIGQFAEKYSDLCNRPGNKTTSWASSTLAVTPAPVLEANVSDMINKTFEVLYVLNALKDEKNNRDQQSEIELIRNKRLNPGASPVRPKYRRRLKRPAPPGRCQSCNIQETPEWRRGPDGARTLCNACGLHFAKLNRKRAQLALREQEMTQISMYQPQNPYAQYNMP